MRLFEEVKPEHRTCETEIKLPRRADDGSAGYDFYLPKDIMIQPGETVIVPMDVKVAMEKDDVLLLFVRSSVGIKKHIVLANGTGVIDSTYYSNPDNDGNICAALTNLHPEYTQVFKKGDRIMQGVFVKYLITDEDLPVSDNRTGGIGSSGE